MKIEILEKNYNVGVRLNGLILKKVGKLEKYFDKDASCKVVCKKEGNLFKLEMLYILPSSSVNLFEYSLIIPSP